MNNLNELKSKHKALNPQELKEIMGGRALESNSYTCYCGFTGGQYEELTVMVEADSVGDALNSMNCGGVGATCNGN